jgi:endonuclease YncB( thermonuclease family)
MKIVLTRCPFFLKYGRTMKGGIMKIRAYVIEVIDGDTFKTKRDTIRLANVDAPELGSDNGRKAKKKLEELILNKWIEYEEKARDDYRRM